MCDRNIIGCSKSTLANMISYVFGLNGSSYVVDSACSSGLYAIAVAYNCIMSGECEDAIVGAGNICLEPSMNLQFYRLGIFFIKIAWSYASCL